MPDQPSGRRASSSVVAIALALLFSPAVVAGQETPPAESETRIVYEREVFQYPRSGRPDPFRSLVRAGAMGMRASDISVRGIMHDPDPRQSVAILAVTGSDRPVRARVGDRVGGIRILAIHPRRVDVLIEELGVARRESLHLRVTPEQGAQ